MKMISANKLNRLWKNGVVAKMVAKTKVLKTMEEISANTSEENVAGAAAVKELSNKLAAQPVWIRDSTGRITGYRIGGADTEFPFNSLISADFTKIIESNMINGIGANGSHTFTQHCPLVLCLWIGYHQSRSDEDNIKYTLTGSHGAVDSLISRIDHYSANSITLDTKVITIRDVKPGATLTMSFSGYHHMSYICAYLVQ